MYCYKETIYEKLLQFGGNIKKNIYYLGGRSVSNKITITFPAQLKEKAQ